MRIQLFKLLLKTKKIKLYFIFVYNNSQLLLFMFNESIEFPQSNTMLWTFVTIEEIYLIRWVWS